MYLFSFTWIYIYLKNKYILHKKSTEENYINVAYRSMSLLWSAIIHHFTFLYNSSYLFTVSRKSIQNVTCLLSVTYLCLDIWTTKDNCTGPKYWKEEKQNDFKLLFRGLNPRVLIVLFFKVLVNFFKRPIANSGPKR